MPARPLAAPFTIVVTGVAPGVGATTIARGLAEALANLDQRVGVVGLNRRANAAVARALAGDSFDRDVLIVDAGAGIAARDLAAFADYILLVSTIDLEALGGAYAVVKQLTAIHAARPIGVVLNRACDRRQAHAAFEQLSRAADYFLGCALRDGGAIADDVQLRQNAVRDASGLSGSVRLDFDRLAENVLTHRPTDPDSGPMPPALALTNGRRIVPSAETPRCA